MSVDEHTIELAGSPVFYRTAPGPGVPVLYLHGVPTSSDDFVGLLGRTGGIAPDLIGFGRSGKGGHLDYSVEGLADAVEPLLDRPVRVVGHDWGAVVALELAVRHPGLIEALVLCNPLPLVEGFAWHGPARIWSRPLLGEFVMGAANRWLVSRTLRAGTTRPELWTPERLAAFWEQFDQGTQRATLRLHRGTDPHRLEHRLERVQAPTLILWGEEDPWCPVGLADHFAAALPNATLERIPGAGHWPWLEDGKVAERIMEG